MRTDLSTDTRGPDPYSLSRLTFAVQRARDYPLTAGVLTNVSEIVFFLDRW